MAKKKGDKSYSLEVRRWFDAINLAKILFEDQGYHWRYLDEVKRFIRRKAPHHPKKTGYRRSNS